jgi:hypothetical protein
MHEPDPYLPPPCNLDFEGEILSAGLDGHVTVAELAPLEPKHFYGHIHQATWEAIRDNAPGDVDGVLHALHTRGWRGDLEGELRHLALHQPWVSLTRLRAHVQELIELWRRRETIALLRNIEVEVRRGLDAGAAREIIDRRLREVVG